MELNIVPGGIIYAVCDSLAKYEFDYTCLTSLYNPKTALMPLCMHAGFVALEGMNLIPLCIKM